MQKAFVLDNNKQPLMPCHPARARELLRKGKAAVYRLQPFTIILKNRSSGNVQPIEFKADPGSKTTGIALVLQGKNGKQVTGAANLHHRGQSIKDALAARRAIRRSRRNRKTRYRAPRFLNRTRPNGWLAPSLVSRVDNLSYWARRLIGLAPISSIAYEAVKFDMQKLRNPEIDGTEYQQGTLFGFEVKEYLLYKFNHQCAYCDERNKPLEKEHVLCKKRGGSNSVTNLVISCRECNKEKGTQLIDDFLANKPARLARIKQQLKSPLKDAAAINSIRNAIGQRLKQFSLPVSTGTGGQTKFNRVSQSYHKDHWIDAACVGDSGCDIAIPQPLNPLHIKATGRGTRQMCRVNKYGFPRTSAKANKSIKGFATGDMVKAIVPKGKKTGTYIGRVAVRSNGYFNIKAKNKLIQGISHNYCTLLQKNDGYEYSTTKIAKNIKEEARLVA